MEIDNLALNLEEIEKQYPENPLEFFRGKKLCLLDKFQYCLACLDSHCSYWFKGLLAHTIASYRYLWNSRNMVVLCSTSI